MTLTSFSCHPYRTVTRTFVVRQIVGHMEQGTPHEMFSLTAVQRKLSPRRTCLGAPNPVPPRRSYPISAWVLHGALVPPTFHMYKMWYMYHTLSEAVAHVSFLHYHISDVAFVVQLAVLYENLLIHDHDVCMNRDKSGATQWGFRIAAVTCQARL